MATLIPYRRIPERSVTFYNESGQNALGERYIFGYASAMRVLKPYGSANALNTYQIGLDDRST